MLKWINLQLKVQSIIGMDGMIDVPSVKVLLVCLLLCGCTPPTEVDCTGCHPTIERMIPTAESHNLYQCSNTKQWWEDGCERNFTGDENE